MRKPIFLTLAALSVFALLTAVPASAQAPATANTPPPKLEKLEEGEAPAITIRQPSTASEITESRGPGGEIKEIKVKSGGSTYYLRPRSSTATAVGDNVSTPQWVIHEFDAGIPKRDKEPVQPQRLEPAPPPAK